MKTNCSPVSSLADLMLFSHFPFIVCASNFRLLVVHKQKREVELQCLFTIHCASFRETKEEKGDGRWNVKTLLISLNCVCSVCHYEIWILLNCPLDFVLKLTLSPWRAAASSRKAGVKREMGPTQTESAVGLASTTAHQCHRRWTRVNARPDRPRVQESSNVRRRWGRFSHQAEHLHKRDYWDHELAMPVCLCLHTGTCCLMTKTLLP